MGSQLFANNVLTTLASGLTDSATSVSITSASGWPAIGTGDWHYCTISNSAESVFEIVKVTARTTTTLTVVRAQDGTTAVAWNAGDTISIRPCKAAMADLLTAARLPVARLGVNDGDQTVSNTTDVTVAYSAISAARAVTLPAATIAGQVVAVVDESGSCSATNTITINRAGSDTIDGQTSIVLGAPYTSIRLVADGTSKWTIQRTQFRSKTFTADGSWVAPAGVHFVHLTLAGGGGGGAGCNGSAAGAGGGGGQVVQGVYAVAPGTSYSVTIGTAGTAGAANAGNGGNGGTTAFGAVVNAYGGSGGLPSVLTLAASFTVGKCGAYGGSQASQTYALCLSSTTLYPGIAPPGAGGAPGQDSTATGGGSGGSFMGLGGVGGTTANTLPGGGGGGGSYGAGGAGGNGKTNGTAGTAAAANTGGGGGGAGAGSTGLTGGAGGTGICIVSWLE
jgi:hypothetical protein